MSLTAGTRIGPYEIVAQIGAGGMGEVYRARDTRLDRDVAIKILPPAFAADIDRLARFDREAKTLASLNHPNIAQIYGLEVAQGFSPAVSALVMELVDGEDLSDRIARGAIPMAEALPIAREIALALEAAHERGVIHRDLKPANIKVSTDGAVKVLDFGLAKAMDTVGRDFSPGSMDLMNSPTITSPATQLGMIIGTAAYMAPEQAKGRAIDRRADVWAFGVVLFEMLTGRRVFAGDDISDVLASVLKDAPPHDALPADTPPAVRRLLRRCLEKDRAKRLDSMAAARMEIDDALGAPEAAGARATAGMSLGRAAMVVGIAAIAAAMLGGAAVWRAMRPVPAPVQRLSLTTPSGGPVQIETNHQDVALTRDGTRVVFWDRQAQGENRFVVRPLGEFNAMAVEAGLNPRGMSVSPDGGWLVYQSGAPNGTASILQKIAITGGTPQKLAAIEGNLRGASWTRGGAIVFATTRINQGLMRVPASGGAVDVLTTPDTKAGETDHLWPHVLPGDRHVLFVIRRIGVRYDVAVLDLQTRSWRVIVPNATMPRYVPTGHLLYSAGGVLNAMRLDASSGSPVGDPVAVIDGVLTKESGAANYDVSDNGTLVYMAGTLSRSESVLTWIDRSGKRTPLQIAPRQYRSLRFSPDGLKAAATIDEDGVVTAWLLDFERKTLSRLAPLDVTVMTLAWSPDGRTIALGVGSAGSDNAGIHLVSASGTGTLQRVTAANRGVRHTPTHWNGAGIFFSEAGDAPMDVLRLDPASGKVTPVLYGPSAEGGGVLSHDGRWLAYSSDETGRQEVYVRPYPNVGDDRIIVTSIGARNPFWAADDRELLFVSARGVPMRVRVGHAGGRLTLGTPEVAMDDPDWARSPFAAFAADGSRVLTAVRPESAAAVNEYRVILNWFEELKARVK